MPSKLGPYNVHINVIREMRKRALLRALRRGLRAALRVIKKGPSTINETEEGTK